MNRRDLLTASVFVLAGIPRLAAAAGTGHVEYSREAFDKARGSGKPLLLDFYAEW